MEKGNKNTEYGTNKKINESDKIYITSSSERVLRQSEYRQSFIYSALLSCNKENTIKYLLNKMSLGSNKQNEQHYSELVCWNSCRQ